jgi:acyl dehydratase/putative sterol carrier protein
MVSTTEGDRETDHEFKGGNRMALNRDAIGRKIGPLTKTYTWRDVVLYALGVGAGFSDLEYCYEKDLKVIPSFSIAAIFDFLARAGRESNVNPAGILHGEQELIFHHPIPPEGALTTEGRITHYYDKGKEKGALVVAESDTFHSDGDKLFTSVATLFSRLDGGFGGPNAPKNEATFPDREPDAVVKATPSKDQPLLYRLSGDIFQLHVDPEFARMAGFEKPIMHGLCTHGFACRALIRALMSGEPERTRRLACRFARPLYPGTPVETLIWKAGDGRALWKTVNAETGEAVITHGIFEYGEAPEDGIRFDDRSASEGNPAIGAVFDRMARSFNPEAAEGVDLVFQFHITGESGGDRYCLIRDRVCIIEPGVHERPACILRMKQADFADMMTGRLPPMTAFTSGKLRVEGDVMKAGLIEKLFTIG